MERESVRSMSVAEEVVVCIADIIVSRAWSGARCKVLMEM
jgi:hypothetical protein